MKRSILLAAGAALVRVDAGFPKKEQVVFDAIAALGRQPSDPKHLVFTRSHPATSAALGRRARGPTSTPPSSAETGGPFRPMTAAPRLVHGILYRLVWHPNERTHAFGIDQPRGGWRNPVGGLRAVHVPGHDAGQLA